MTIPRFIARLDVCIFHDGINANGFFFSHGSTVERTRHHDTGVCSHVYDEASQVRLQGDELQREVGQGERVQGVNHGQSARC